MQVNFVPIAYALQCFLSSCGEYLATCSSAPDRRLCLWRWREEAMLAEAPSPNREEHSLTLARNDHTKLISCGEPGSFDNFLT